MKSVFYDLETSDRNYCGQILNYAFIEVGDQFELRSECCGTVKPGRLQLPVPDAILANRVNLELLMADPQAQSEKEASARISSYLSALCDSDEQPIALIGFNSSRFDIHYLRTTLIRNGFNPYFGGRLVQRDLLHCAKKLSATRRDFPRCCREQADVEGQATLSLALQTISKALGLLDGKQLHESRADVLLSIKLAQLFEREFGLDVRSEMYEVPQQATRGALIAALAPSYDLKGTQIAERRVKLLLDQDHRNALWLDLMDYAEGAGRQAISWINKSSGLFIAGEDASTADLDLALVQRALREFRELTVKNFFARSVCDIELDIYRLDFDALDALVAAIALRDARAVKALGNEDALAIFRRHGLANYRWGQANDDQVRRALKDYALYRYKGGMILSKTIPEGEEQLPLHRHETAKSMLERTRLMKSAASTSEDQELLQALERHYLQSEIFSVAGDELLTNDANGASV